MAQSCEIPPLQAVSHNGTPWQLKMFSRTLKKKLRLGVLRSMLGAVDGQHCLLVTCGDNNGAINYQFRGVGGRWSWAECESVSIREMTMLLGEDVTHVNPCRLPYSDGQFDCVVAIDVHEHLQNPDVFTCEIRRVLKTGGRALITVPTGDPRKLANRLKNAIGMTREKYGHVRDGFSIAELSSLMRQAHLEPHRAVTFSRFFTELLELGINYVYVQKLAKRSDTPVRAGTIAPATSEQLRSVRTTYWLYSSIYPLVWGVSQLDRLLPFTSGYVVVVEGTKGA